jgi:hypothetical protein
MPEFGTVILVCQYFSGPDNNNCLVMIFCKVDSLLKVIDLMALAGVTDAVSISLKIIYFLKIFSDFVFNLYDFAVIYSFSKNSVSSISLSPYALALLHKK